VLRQDSGLGGGKNASWTSQESSNDWVDLGKLLMKATRGDDGKDLIREGGGQSHRTCWEGVTGRLFQGRRGKNGGRASRVGSRRLGYSGCLKRSHKGPKASVVLGGAGPRSEGLFIRNQGIGEKKRGKCHVEGLGGNKGGSGKDRKCIPKGSFGGVTEGGV